MNGRRRDQLYRRLRKENRELRQQLESKEQELRDLMEVIAELRQKLQSLSDEIKVLKNLPKLSQLKPSRIHKR